MSSHKKKIETNQHGGMKTGGLLCSQLLCVVRRGFCFLVLPFLSFPDYFMVPIPSILFLSFFFFFDVRKIKISLFQDQRSTIGIEPMEEVSERETKEIILALPPLSIRVPLSNSVFC